MPTKRIIRQENPPAPIDDKEKLLEKKDDLEKVTMKPEEIKELFNQRAPLNMKSLYVNEELYKKFKAYIEYQKRLKSLKQQWAEHLLEKYIIPEEMCDTKNTKTYTIFVNGQKVTAATIYYHPGEGSLRSIITLNHFKYITLEAGSDMVSCIDSSKNGIFIDLRLWVMEKKGQIRIDAENAYITIP